MSSSSHSKQELTKVHDTWYRSAAGHWEDTPGKEVLIAALKVCCLTDQHLRLLDVACGTGSFLMRIHKEVSKNWQLHGVDYSREAIEHACGRHRHFHFLCADATSLHFASGAFDVVTLCGSWEHVKDPEPAIIEAGRVLSPGGWVFAMIPTLGVHRTGDDGGWHEDIKLSGCDKRQMQWNLKRPNWEEMFDRAGIQLMADSLAQKCGALKPGVFFFGVKLANKFGSTTVKLNMTPAGAALIDLSRLAARLASKLEPEIEAASCLILESVRSGGKVLACGNGGSAADALHFVAELVGRMSRERQSLPAISLGTDPSVVTALSNDYGYDRLFARQVEGLGQPGDVLLAISTSGRSPNVLSAVESARRRGVHTIALLGEGGDPILADCDVCIHIPSHDTQRVQELHTAVLHAVCDYVEQQLVAGTLD